MTAKALASSGVRRPSPIAVQIEAIAGNTSCVVFIGGMTTFTGWPLRGGQRRSRSIRRQDTSPALAKSTAFWKLLGLTLSQLFDQLGNAIP